MARSIKGIEFFRTESGGPRWRWSCKKCGGKMPVLSCSDIERKITNELNISGKGTVLICRHEGATFKVGQHIKYKGVNYEIVALEMFVKPL